MSSSNKTPENTNQASSNIEEETRKRPAGFPCPVPGCNRSEPFRSRYHALCHLRGPHELTQSQLDKVTAGTLYRDSRLKGGRFIPRAREYARNKNLRIAQKEAAAQRAREAEDDDEEEDQEDEDGEGDGEKYVTDDVKDKAPESKAVETEKDEEGEGEGEEAVTGDVKDKVFDSKVVKTEENGDFEMS